MLGTPAKPPSLDYAPPPKPFARLRRPVTFLAIFSLLFLPLSILIGHFFYSFNFDVYSTTFIGTMSMRSSALLVAAICIAPAACSILLAVIALRRLKRAPPSDDIILALAALGLDFWWIVRTALAIHTLYHIYIPWL